MNEFSSSERQLVNFYERDAKFCDQKCWTIMQECIPMRCSIAW